MKLNEPIWAIVHRDGTVAGSGDGYCTYGRRKWAEDDLRDNADYLHSMNGTTDLRVMRVVLRSASPAPTPNGATTL